MFLRTGRVNIWLKALFTSFVIFISIFFLHTAFAAESRVVRVVYYPLENYHAEDSKGNVVGYEVDYLNRIAEITGWTYEYIKADSWADAIEMLREGKADLLSPSHILDDRLGYFGFGSIPVGKVYGAIFTLNINEQMMYEDFSQFSNLTFGIVRRECPTAICFQNTRRSIISRRKRLKPTKIMMLWWKR